MNYYAMPAVKLRFPSMPNTNMLKIIENEVCKQYKLSPVDLRTRCRKRVYSMPRHMFMYLAASFTKHSLVEIGHHLGKYHHTTVIHAKDTVKGYIQFDEQLSETANTLKLRCGL